MADVTSCEKALSINIISMSPILPVPSQRGVLWGKGKLES